MSTHQYGIAQKLMESFTDTPVAEIACRTAASLLSRGEDLALCRFPGQPVTLFTPGGDRKTGVSFRVKPRDKAPAFDFFPFSGIPDTAGAAVPNKVYFAKPLEPATDFDTYAAGFALLSKAFARKIAQKAVLSRVKHVNLPSNFGPVEFFEKAAAAYPDALISLTATKAHGIWLGATPEVLLRSEGDTLITYSLAATRPAATASPWGKKEVREQELVSRHIRTVLRKFNIEDVRESKPHTVGAGPVEHLLTTFRFPAQKNISGLIDALHPTPAISGLPTRAAAELIGRAEKHKRGLYTGYLGKIAQNPDKVNETQLYVNLRCMCIGRDSAAIYSGGGITAESVLNDEWEETEKKALTLTSLLND